MSEDILNQPEQQPAGGEQSPRAQKPQPPVVRPKGPVVPKVSVDSGEGDDFEIDIRITIRPGRGKAAQPALGSGILGTCGGSCPVCPSDATCGDSCPVCSIHGTCHNTCGGTCGCTNPADCGVNVARTNGANTCAVTCMSMCDQAHTCLTGCFTQAPVCHGG